MCPEKSPVGVAFHGREGSWNDFIGESGKFVSIHAARNRHTTDHTSSSIVVECMAVFDRKLLSKQLHRCRCQISPANRRVERR